MPIYEYECLKCGIHFDQQQRITDDPLRVCPECAGQVRRVFHPAMVIYKGSGFYTTDNRRSSAGTNRKPKSGEDTSKNGKTESIESSPAKSEGEKSASKA